MKKIIEKAKSSIKKIFVKEKTFKKGIGFWKYRVKVFGKHSVLHVGHANDSYELITKQQKNEMYPHFLTSLKGDEKVVLDFGCGPGRFTVDLANMIKGRAIGIDPIKSLIKIAPKEENVRYALMKEGKIPLPDEYVDVVWVCLVIGGIRDNMLEKTAKEINRVLKRNGLLFLIENTSSKEISRHWSCLSFQEFQNMFNFVKLNHLHDYFDLGERISIMSGKKI